MSVYERPTPWARHPERGSYYESLVVVGGPRPLAHPGRGSGSVFVDHVKALVLEPILQGVRDCFILGSAVSVEVLVRPVHRVVFGGAALRPRASALFPYIVFRRVAIPLVLTNWR